MDEEAKVRLGIDIGPFATGIRNAERQMKQAGENMHGSFLHVGSAARGFHKVLEEVSAQSPIMGTALRLAINPIVGAFAAATIAASFFKDKIAEINAQSDALEKGMSDPITKTKDNLRAAHKALAEFNYEQQKWLRDLHANDNTIDKQLASRLGALGAQSAQLKKLGGNDEDIERQRLLITLGLQKGASRALGIQQDDLGGALAIQSEEMRRSNAEQRAQRLMQMNETEKETQAKLQILIDKERQGPGNVVSAAGGFLGGLRRMLGIGSGQELSENSRLTDLQKQLEASKYRMEKNNQAIDNDTLARKALTDKINELRSKITTSHTEQQRINQEIEATTRQLSYMSSGQTANRPFQPFDFGSYYSQSEANRLSGVQRNDLAYRLAHLNDPRSATGAAPVTLESLSADIKQQLIDLNEKADTGIPVFGAAP